MPAAGGRKYQVGDFTVDTARYRISRGGAAVPVEPKVFDLLVYLIRNRDRVLTREELFQAVWDGREVSDATLSNHVKIARKALGDSGDLQQTNTFHAELAAELALHDEHWEKPFDEGPEALAELVGRVKPLSAHRVLRPFLEAYRVVADALLRRGADARLEEEPFLRECLALGRQYALQRRIEKQESESKVIFASALSLAKNRGLCDPATPDLVARRRAFAHELREVIRRVEGVQALVRARQAGVHL